MGSFSDYTNTRRSMFKFIEDESVSHRMYVCTLEVASVVSRKWKQCYTR